jgi:hypothetical protein
VSPAAVDSSDHHCTAQYAQPVHERFMVQCGTIHVLTVCPCPGWYLSTHVLLHSLISHSCIARCNKPLLRVQPDSTSQPLHLKNAAIALLLQPVAPAACRCQVAAAASINMQSYVSVSKLPSHQATRSLLATPTTPDGGHLYNWSNASTSNAILVVISSSLPGVFTRHCWSGHPAPTAAGAST